MTTSGLEDSRLVRRCQGGDLEAFNQLVLKYQDRVFDAVYRLTGEYADAQDLAQECFVKAFTGIKEFRGHSSFYTWLFRIAVNGALSRRRSDSRRERHVSGRYETPEELGLAAIDGGEVEPVQAVQQQEERTAVVEALRRLDPEQRAVIVLKDIEGADYERLSEILQCPRGTVKSRLHRARQALRAELEKVMRA